MEGKGSIDGLAYQLKGNKGYRKGEKEEKPVRNLEKLKDLKGFLSCLYRWIDGRRCVSKSLTHSISMRLPVRGLLRGVSVVGSEVSMLR